MVGLSGSILQHVIFDKPDQGLLDLEDPVDKIEWSKTIKE